MALRYHAYHGRLVPDYVCQKDGVEQAERPCQSIPGRTIDEAVGSLLVESMTPLSLDVALAVEDEMRQRASEVDRLMVQAVERARYEADLAQRRYMRVDPDNRLVADALEAEWNARLRDLEEAQKRFEEERKSRAVFLTEERRQEIRSLAEDFPRLWNDPRTSHRERKRMARLLIEDVTLLKGDEITIHVRFRGGATRTLSIPLLLSAPDARRTPREVVQEVDALLDHHTDEGVASELNARGFRTGTGQTFDRLLVRNVRQTYGLKDRYSRLRESGLLTKEEIAQKLGIHPATVKDWRRRGLLEGIPYDDKGECLYMCPKHGLPPKWKHKQTWLERSSLEPNGRSAV